MRRKISEQLLEWKNTSKGRSAILIEGARRVGKSYTVEQFAKTYYKSYLLLDFNKVPDDIKRIFEQNLEDLDTFFMYLSNYYQVRLYERESLLIFDEVQLFPRARSAIKYLVADGRYDYIETGSLVSIKSNTADILIPSEERSLEMHPMDFEEFLWAMGNEHLYQMIEECFTKKKSMSILHRKAMEYLRLYEIIGGMPQAVQRYLDTQDFELVDKVKRDILGLYRDDIQKHAGIHAERAKQIFDDIPAQLMRHDKKFRLSELDENARMRSYGDSFVWLDDAKIVNMCYNTTEPSVGLFMNLDRTSRKVYLADTGLLISQAFGARAITSEEIYKKILFDKLSFNSGMIVENLVAQMLKASDHELFFYTESDREQKDNRMEVDFLIQKALITSRKNILPIEVKSGKNYTLTSLNKYREKFKNEVGGAYVVHTGDLAVEDGITYLPLYMVGLL